MTFEPALKEEIDRMVREGVARAMLHGASKEDAQRRGDEIRAKLERDATDPTRLPGELRQVSLFGSPDDRGTPPPVVVYTAH